MPVRFSAPRAGARPGPGEARGMDGLRCYRCGGTDVTYKKCKVFCVRCGQLIANCCGD